MHAIHSPIGETIKVPATRAEDQDYFTLDQAADAKAYFEEHGYVVFRSLLPKALTGAARAAWNGEMKPYPGFVYRQTTANPELNVINDRGFVMNPVLNLQDLPTRTFPSLKTACLDIYSHPAVREAAAGLMGEAGKLVQSMYFEGNSATWAHQDTYYLDSEKIGAMVAGWFALENIKPGAGRFYIYPGSHRIDVKKNGGDFDIAFNHDRYKDLIAGLIKGRECRAPCLDEGDVLFWHASTIHGSLETNQPDHSRSSLTAHYIPESHRFLQLQSRIKPLAIDTYAGLKVHKPKNQDRAKNRAILYVETRFPKTFQLAKKVAVKLVTR